MTDSNPYDLPPEPEPLDNTSPDPTMNQMPTDEERNLAMIAHISGLIGVFTAGYVGFLGPLIVYLVKKDTSYFVEEQAKEALNFQITMFIVALVMGIIVAISCFVLFPLFFVTPVLQCVFGIIATLAVRDGSSYRYPINIRFFR